MDAKLASYFATLKEGKGGAARAARDELVNFKMRVAGLVEAFCKRVRWGWSCLWWWLSHVVATGWWRSKQLLQGRTCPMCWKHLAPLPSHRPLQPHPRIHAGAGQPPAAGRHPAAAGWAGGRQPAGRPPGACRAAVRAHHQQAVRLQGRGGRCVPGSNFVRQDDAVINHAVLPNTCCCLPRPYSESLLTCPLPPLPKRRRGPGGGGPGAAAAPLPVPGLPLHRQADGQRSLGGLYLPAACCRRRRRAR